MTVLTAKTHKDIQDEYNRLFEKDVIRDEDRAYQWHAKNILQYADRCDVLLDVACGGGFLMREIKKISGKSGLTGIDISTQALALAQKECPQGKYLAAVAESLPFAQESFDAITCLGSLEHFLDIEKAIAEMRRVIKPGGIFYIMVPNMFWFKDILSVLIKGDAVTRNQTQERFATLGEWKRILEDAGVKVVRSIKYNGIAHSALKQRIKDLFIPLRFSYHFIFICRKG